MVGKDPFWGGLITGFISSLAATFVWHYRQRILASTGKIVVALSSVIFAAGQVGLLLGHAMIKGGLNNVV